MFAIIIVGDRKMDALMLILIFIILIICILSGIYAVLYNKFQDYVIRINEVESNIDTILRNKYDTINKCVSIIKGNDEINNKLDKNMFEEIVKLRARKISNFDLDRKLVEANNQFITIKEKYEEINKNEDIIKYSNDLIDIDDRLKIQVNYYNKNIAEYNKLIKLFPTNIVARLCKYQEKLFFDRKDMSDEDYNDFKL